MTESPRGILFLLFSWLFPGVGGDDDLPGNVPNEDAPPNEDDAPPGDPGDDGDDGEDDLPDPEEIAASRAARRQTQTPALNPEAIAADAAARAVAAVRQAPAPPPRDPEYDREQKIIDDPDADPWVKFAAQTSRRLRDSERNSQAAMRAAADAADKGAFYSKYAGHAKIAKFLPEVEKQIARLSAGGGAPPREEVLDWVLGKAYRTAMESGTKTRKAKPAAPTAEGTRVDRGRPAGVRSDVGRGGASERDKLRARLKGVPL